MNSITRLLVITVLFATTSSPSWGQVPAPSSARSQPMVPSNVEEWKKTAGGSTYFRYRKTQTFTVEQNPDLTALRYERSSRRDEARRSRLVEQEVTRVFRQSETGIRERKERTQEITLPDQHVQNTETRTIFRQNAPGDVAWERTGVELLESPGVRVRVTTSAVGKRASSDGVDQVDTITETWKPGTMPVRWRASFRKDHPEVLARFGPDVVGYTRTIVTEKYAAPRPDGSTGKTRVTEQVTLKDGRAESRTSERRLNATLKN